MMGFYSRGYGYDGMMGGSSIICFLIAVVVLVDLVLLGIWLWKKINNDKDRSHRSE